jgi:hypothetical protein
VDRSSANKALDTLKKIGLELRELLGLDVVLGIEYLISLLVSAEAFNARLRVLIKKR